MSNSHGSIYLTPSDNSSVAYRFGISHRSEPREVCTLVLDKIDTTTAELLDRRTDRQFVEPENYNHVRLAFHYTRAYAGEITEAQIHELYETIVSFM